MAVNAAHLTRTLNEKPSIFEVVAQESLHSTIQPAIRRLVEFIVSLNPRKFNWLLKWFDEIYLLFNSVLQYNYVRTYAASFAEHFYGLRRVAIRPQMFSDGFHLPNKEEKISILLLTVFPYVRQKLNQLAEQYRLDEADEITPKNWQGTFRKVLIKFQGIFHFLYESLMLVQYLAYISGKSESPTILLWLASATLKYPPSEEANERTWSEFWTDVKSGNFRSAGLSFEMVGSVLLRGLEFGAFFVQFLKWWDEKGPKMNSNTLPVPEAPRMDVRATQHSNRCPICMQKWKIPTVVPVSGYVYCYSCIKRYLDEDSRCPVTKYPTSVDTLTRLYV